MSNQLFINRMWCNKTRTIRYVTKGKSTRRVGLNGLTRDLLYPNLSDGLIFMKPDGSRLTHQFLSRYLLPRLCKEAKVPFIGTHGFRHTFGAHYMMNRGSLWDLQKILGHSDVSTTEKYYAHFDRDHVSRRAEIVSLGENVIQVQFKKEVG